MGLSIELISEPVDEIRTLLAELDAELSSGYEPHQRHALSLDALFKPEVRFYAAYLDERAVGCGGVAFLGDFAELKRMYCRPAVRGQGVAPALLSKIESTARDAGFTRLRLETGVHQHAAIRFYERSGFRVRGPFGAYAAMAPQAIALSAFFEKTVPQVDAPLTPLLRDLL